MSSPSIRFLAIEPPVHDSPPDLAGVYRVQLSDGSQLEYPIRKSDRIGVLKRVVKVLFESRAGS